MILTGRPVAADEAMAIGLANRIVAAREALTVAQSLAAQIANFTALCMKTDRMSVYQQWGFELTDALRNEGREGV